MDRISLYALTGDWNLCGLVDENTAVLTTGNARAELPLDVAEKLVQHHQHFVAMVKALAMDMTVKEAFAFADEMDKKYEDVAHEMRQRIINRTSVNVVSQFHEPLKI